MKREETKSRNFASHRGIMLAVCKSRYFTHKLTCRSNNDTQGTEVPS